MYNDILSFFGSFADPCAGYSTNFLNQINDLAGAATVLRDVCEWLLDVFFEY
jgi:hypothetical protein